MSAPSSSRSPSMRATSNAPPLYRMSSSYEEGITASPLLASPLMASPLESPASHAQSTDDDLDDFSLESSCTLDGVAHSTCQLDAKQFGTLELAAQMLKLLRDDLALETWSTLPPQLPASMVSVHKVSGSLTNAVFFVSVPNEDDAEEATAATAAAADEDPREGASTPVNRSPTIGRSQTIRRQPAPRVAASTVLVRVYGPSSGTLIQRSAEMRVLHLLSSEYGIGPRILGTFANGRVEQYFYSEALTRSLLREPVMSRWIACRMRELHRVDLGQVDAAMASDRHARAERPGARRRATSVNSNASSVFSLRSTDSLQTVNELGDSNGNSGDSGGNGSVSAASLASPRMRPRRGSSVSSAISKKRSRSLFGSASRVARDGVWTNIMEWTREAQSTLAVLDDLARLTHLFPSASAGSTPQVASPTERSPLASLHDMLTLRAALNLPLFEQQVRLYYNYVRDWEKREGESPRVFCHNDAQYGNLLLMTAPPGMDQATFEAQFKSPHQKLIVVDFEYASVNPRAFDIANHFIEWTADYHHPTLSYSLTSHGAYPTLDERARFYKAYVDSGSVFASSTDDTSSQTEALEDLRVQRLEAEVNVWTAASSAMWAVWGIVQAKADLHARVAQWRTQAERFKQRPVSVPSLDARLARVTLGKEDESAPSEPSRPPVHRGKSGELETDDVDADSVPVIEFDYLNYALGRMRRFRDDIGKLGVLD